MRYGMQRNGETDNSFYQSMMDGLWQAINAQELFRLLHDDMCGEIASSAQRAHAARGASDYGCQRFIQQHYQERCALRM